MKKDTLYYDGQCPICSAEIKKLDKFSKGKIELQDIHNLDETDDLPDKSELMEVLHLRTDEGEWLTGVDANIRAWHHTPFRYFWRFLGLPGIRNITEAAYKLWLDWTRKKKTGK